MTLTGISSGSSDGTPRSMRGRTGFDTSYETNTLSFGAGESFDTIFTAPAFTGGTGTSGQGYDTYVLYNRAYTRSDNLVGDGGGQRTRSACTRRARCDRRRIPTSIPDDVA